MSDTIAAVATALSPSGIGIVRISGEGSMEVIQKIYRSKNGKKQIKEAASHTIHYGYIYNEGQLVDEVLVMIMRGPRTYTGEDTVEIDCHGGVYAMNQVLETVLQHGARIAEPGEFTKRAFLNGRLDLSQAEAVIDVIHAKSEYALKSSLSQLKGGVKKEIEAIRGDIIYHIAYIESALDDPEHVNLDGYPAELAQAVDRQKDKIARLVATYSEGKMIKEGIKTVILGKPNAGKSSLLNLMVGENKAIVTEIAGTTRDILEETITLHGISLQIIDTAGIRETNDLVEKIGVGRARESAKDADLILYVVDSSAPLDDNDREIMEMLEEKQAIVVFNKTDLQPVISIEELQQKTGRPVVSVSAKEETGMEELGKQIREMFFHGEISFNDEVYITNARHRKMLQEALECLENVSTSIKMEMPEDFYSIDLMGAYECLGKVLGQEVGEDLVNEIFSKFCTGK